MAPALFTSIDLVARNLAFDTEASLFSAVAASVVLAIIFVSLIIIFILNELLA